MAPDAAAIDDRVHVAIRSYGRAGRVKTHRVAPFAYVWVPASQAAAYEPHHPGRVIAIPDEADGNLGRKNNAILDRTPRDWTLILNDDITAIGYWEDGVIASLTPEHFAAVIAHHFELAAGMGVRMWGINQNHDNMAYDAFKPFSLLAPILGPFVAHLAPELRYDEAVLGKDDYDFWLLNIQRHRRTLRANKYHYIHGLGVGKGGFAAMRTHAVEQAGVDAMRRKWGDAVYRSGGHAGGNPHAKGKNILNSIVRVPIPGC